MRIVILLVFCFSFFFCGAQQRKYDLDETIKFQKHIIEQLTGELPVRGNRFLNQRSSPSERTITANYLSSVLTEIGLSPKHHKYKTPNSVFVLDLLFRPFRGINVYSIIPATQPSNEYVVFGAHYDTERGSPGAIDNGTGISVCLRLAERLNRLSNRKTNFIVVFFDQEEDDEVGSGAFADWLQSKDWVIKAIHTIDTIGWDSDGDRLFSIQSPPSHLEVIYREEASLLNIPLNIVSGASSDNKSFLIRGFEVVGVSEAFQDITPHIHKPTDKSETIDFEYLAIMSELIFNVLNRVVDECP